MCTNMQVILCRGPIRDLSSTVLAFRRPVGVHRATFTVRHDRHEYFMKNENFVAVRRTYNKRTWSPNSRRVAADMSLRAPTCCQGIADYSPQMSANDVKYNTIHCIIQLYNIVSLGAAPYCIVLYNCIIQYNTRTQSSAG